MDSQPYNHMHHHIATASGQMRYVREFASEVSETIRRSSKIKAATWDVDQALHKLAHEVFLHQKQTRRAEKL